ncbi:30S ribosomal protein S20 [candidate division WWE3 bacterium CG_4_9_14_3_um_filter_41_6]|uniref:Small ribosomal subunit protein bS20 n=1 Tax=candidate division WWE3 bacterium CG_4_10_14_0_2_um_filter_41_14 TaxID=1975072 RepID=A0A2M7TKU5_UNCKA|nr:MAG: 30S ribosomal protein S20 [candidate division WWE3 bacterium CG_4_10_14_0_2_um_filter_41_14]PJA38877.1 MAG: 30S ribosomal protein S20 [candidate division WWE3 bacterium CG_4_9_14_3_um_filter_41_6]
MANTTSAKRTIPKQERKRVINLRARRSLKTSLTDFVSDPKVESIAKTTKAIDIAAKKGIIHKNKANRLKSQVHKRVS